MITASTRRYRVTVLTRSNKETHLDVLSSRIWTRPVVALGRGQYRNAVASGLAIINKNR